MSFLFFRPILFISQIRLMGSPGRYRASVTMSCLDATCILSLSFLLPCLPSSAVSSTYRYFPSKFSLSLSRSGLQHIVVVAECLRKSILTTFQEKFKNCCGFFFKRRLFKYQLVSQYFEPSHPQRITSGLNTNFTLSPSYSFHSSYHKSFFKIFFSLFIFRGHSVREPASGRVTYFILWAYTGIMCQPQPTQEKSGEVLEKMQVNGPEGQKEARKKSLVVSVACVAIY